MSRRSRLSVECPTCKGRIFIARTARGREIPLTFPPSRDERHGNFIFKKNRVHYISDAERIARVRAGEPVWEYHYVRCSGTLDRNWRARRPVRRVDTERELDAQFLDAVALDSRGEAA